MKEAVNHPRYGIVYHFNYSLILGYHNNWLIIKNLMMGKMKNITIIVEIKNLPLPTHIFAQVELNY